MFLEFTIVYWLSIFATGIGSILVIAWYVFELIAPLDEQ